ncbi:hypothetical protein ACSEN8_03480 [Pseudomonas aeruginosa]|uniref:hypothetical protein n=1 Tax=Pseudomonas aeruginosa TaxID=287 RepID=UPI0015F0CF0D|nr:hypothetical protein [Pseudomonas aeruginosa]MBA5069793.1 hypothetical protein [Pseudomonas aeruginosa]
MSPEVMSQAFNAWMDDYTKNPDAFQSQERLAMHHLNEKLAGEVPSYGQVCSALLMQYAKKFEN